MTIQELEKFSVQQFYDAADQLKSHVYRRSEEAFCAGDAARDAIRSTTELETRNKFMRARFLEAIGGIPSSATPLNPKITGKVNCNGFHIEKVIFESRPATYVTANLYLPDNITEPLPAVLFLCGHWNDAKQQPTYQVVCQYLVRAGLVVLAQDPIGQGERWSYYEKELNGPTIPAGVPEHEYAGLQSLPLGDSIARYFVHDAMRGIDYLCTRPEVDPARIGVTGNSGGGTQTSLMMICDQRIAAAAPGTFIMNRNSYLHAGLPQDLEQIWLKMTALGFDHEDILLAMAPKPVLVLAAKSDYFPIEGTRRTVERVKRFWDMYGMSENVGIIEDDTPHAYTRNLACAAAEFFSRHLLGRQVTPDGNHIEPLEQKQLVCTKSSQVRMDYPGARAVYEENCGRLAEIKKKYGKMPEKDRKEKALAWLKEKVFLCRKTCELNPRYYFNEIINGLFAEAAIWWSQEGIFNHAILFKEYQFKDRKLPPTIALWEGATSNLKPHMTWIHQECSKGRAVIVLDVTGTGNIACQQFLSYPEIDYFSSTHKLADDLLWLDDSLAAMRVYDVLRALDAVALWQGIDAGDIRLYSCGWTASVYVLVASVLDKRIRDIEIHDGMKSYSEWISMRHYDVREVLHAIIPGILHYCDLPDLDRWRKQ